jgi:outer membrane biosynthesis protein TonB
MALLHKVSASFLFVFGILASTMFAQDAGKQEPTEAQKYSSPPLCQHCPNPDFTEEAKNAKIKSASVLLSVTISAEGNAGDIQILRDPGFGLGEKAVKAVRTWTSQLKIRITSQWSPELESKSFSGVSAKGLAQHESASRLF